MPSKDHHDIVVAAPNVKERKYLKSLKCPLTQKELNQASDDLVEALTAIDSINADLEEIKADYKHKIKASEARVGTLRTLLQNKFEMRPVECLEVRNFADKAFFLMRTDTAEIIEERALRQDELQIPLPLEEEPVEETSDGDGAAEAPEDEDADDEDGDGEDEEEEEEDEEKS